MIRKYLLNRYPGNNHRTVAVRKFVEKICHRHITQQSPIKTTHSKLRRSMMETAVCRTSYRLLSKLGHADSNFESNLCSGNDARYWQRLSEALLANELLEAKLNLQPHCQGPDFLVKHKGRNIWIEVICPEPKGLPTEWLQDVCSTGTDFPHEAILLRWTAAIKEKAEKLLGNPEKGIFGYIEKGIVAPDDPYVIAVNGCRLRGKYFQSINGISQFPFAVEAVFAVGPFAIEIDRQTLEAVGSGHHQHRPLIQNANGSPVPAYTFLDPAFRPISAIWAADIDETWAIGNPKPMAVIHNPNATNQIAPSLLPACWDYVARESGNDGYVLERRSSGPSITNASRP